MKKHILGAFLAVATLSLAACEKSKAPAPAASGQKTQATPAHADHGGPAAQPEHAHESPHGGVIADTDTGHLELVASRDGTFKLYVLDDDLRTQPVTGASGTLKLTVPGYADVKLAPEGEALAGTGAPLHAEHATAVVSITVGGATRTGRFALHLEPTAHGDTAAMNHGEHGGGHAHGGTESTPPGFKAELTSGTGEIVTGKPVTLAFAVKDAKGQLVRELPNVHEKPMHLFAISTDLRDFFHLHPEPQADGSYRVAHTFPSGGDYTLIVDYTPKDTPQVVDRIPLSVKGAPRAKQALQADTTNVRTVDGLRVTMTPSKPLRPGEGLVLQFAAVDAKTGKPAADLEPYLGAMAHFAILSADSKDFLHAHPLEETPKGDGKVSAHTTFPRAGLYKVWVQMQRKGQVITVPYVLNVAGAPAAPAHGHGHGHEHTHH